MIFHGNRVRLMPGFIICLLGFCLMGVTVRADIPRPPKPNPAPNPAPDPAPAKADEQQIIISMEAGAKQAHLRIPASALKAAAPAPAPAPRSDSGLSPVRTVVAGIALTAAITITGLLLVRGRGRGRMLLLAVLIGGAGVVASIATANVPPPRRPDPNRVVIPAGGLKVPVVIEIVDDGPVQLTLPAQAPR